MLLHLIMVLNPSPNILTQKSKAGESSCSTITEARLIHVLLFTFDFVFHLDVKNYAHHCVQFTFNRRYSGKLATSNVQEIMEDS